jgi:type VI protein secretion system component VasF
MPEPKNLLAGLLLASALCVLWSGYTQSLDRDNVAEQQRLQQEEDRARIVRGQQIDR